ncbi:MAG: alpha-L-fucosidase [Bacteroidota bacterium]
MTYKQSLIAWLFLCTLQVNAQPPHQGEQPYQWPEDEAVSKKLEDWRDQKFGMIIHWGLYAVPGIIESWALCSEDWIYRDSTSSYCDFKEWYWGLKDEFNPEKFDPDQWAEVADNAGMRYLVFTTKHHDGFNMFDTRQTDFKITNGPFASHPKSNVAKYVFEAFRKKDFMIGAYFSKPDWHTEYYWWPRYATANRNNNYDIRKHPWRWNQYKQFTYNQIEELMSDYGAMDILWLDGGWVRPRETVNEEVLSWGAPIPEWSQDIEMDKIATMARSHQPGLLMVDRTVHGPYENYRTPEQRVPETQLDYPWESCMTLGNAWGYVPNDKFKSSRQVIHTLIEVTAKNGSLLLGVGPDANGLLYEAQIKPLEEIGQWLNVNGEAIYGTRTMDHYTENNIWFTQKEKEGKFYAIKRVNQDEEIPAMIVWTKNIPAEGSKITLAGSATKLKWSVKEDKVEVLIPSSVRKTLQDAPAVVLVVGK